MASDLPHGLADLQPIHDYDILYRRVSAVQMTRDPKSELGWRVSSADWDDPEGDPSTYCARLLEALELTKEAVLDGHATHTLVSIAVGIVRHDVGLDVIHDPEKWENDAHHRRSAHCVITGLPRASKQRKRAKEPLARKCEIVILREPDKP